MADEYDWFSLDFWAEELEKKYPSTNLFSLSDQKLSEMLLSLEAAKDMSALPTKKSYFSALRSAWTVAQYGGDDSKDIPDAYI